jgi:hypothetical protein
MLNRGMEWRAQRPGKTLLLQILACSLCLLMVSALLDRFPDPPAVTKQSIQSVVPPVHHGAPLTGARADWVVFARIFWLDANSPAASRLAEERPPSQRIFINLLRNASDTSPPFLS